MSKYSTGKIYRVEPTCEHDEKDVYYGCTIQPLSQRFGCHVSNYRQWKYDTSGKSRKITIYDLFDKYKIENCKIYLVEDYPCDRREQLVKREGEYIRSNKCVNKYASGRSKEEKEELKNAYKKRKEDELEALRVEMNFKSECVCVNT
jgi:ribosome-interacting GTPase 1